MSVSSTPSNASPSTRLHRSSSTRSNRSINSLRRSLNYGTSRNSLSIEESEIFDRSADSIFEPTGEALWKHSDGSSSTVALESELGIGSDRDSLKDGSGLLGGFEFIHAPPPVLETMPSLEDVLFPVSKDSGSDKDSAFDTQSLRDSHMSSDDEKPTARSESVESLPEEKPKEALIEAVPLTESPEEPAIIESKDETIRGIPKGLEALHEIIESEDSRTGVGMADEKQMDHLPRPDTPVEVLKNHDDVACALASAESADSSPKGHSENLATHYPAEEEEQPRKKDAIILLPSPEPSAAVVPVREPRFQFLRLCAGLTVNALFTVGAIALIEYTKYPQGF